MFKAFGILLLFALAGCSGIPDARYSESACFAAEASYQCQVERYYNVAAP